MWCKKCEYNYYSPFCSMCEDFKNELLAHNPEQLNKIIDKENKENYNNSVLSSR